MRLIAQLQDKLAALDGDHRRRAWGSQDAGRGAIVPVSGVSGRQTRMRMKCSISGRWLAALAGLALAGGVGAMETPLQVGTEALTPAPIPAFTPERWRTRWDGIVV